MLAHVDGVEEATSYLAEVAQRLAPTGLPLELRVAHALNVPRAILDLARGEHIDLIALATHGRGGLSRLVLGSVATRLLVRASVPLLLARPSRRGRQPSDAAHATA